MSFNSSKNTDIRNLIEQSEDERSAQDNAIQQVNFNVLDAAPVTEEFYEILAEDNKSDLVSELRSRQENILRIIVQSSFDLGREYAFAQTAFKDAGMPGRFDDWVAATGYSARTARSLISIYNATVQLPEEQREIFEQLPRELQARLSSQIQKPDNKKDPDTEKVLNQVFDGDVTTLPEFKKALAEQIAKKEKQIATEAKAEAAEKVKTLEDEKKELNAALEDKILAGVESDVELEQLQDKLNSVETELDELRNNPTVKLPEDYERIKREHEQAVEELAELRKSKDDAMAQLAESDRDKQELLARLDATEAGDGNHEKLLAKIAKLDEVAKKRQLEISSLENGERFIKAANSLLDTTLSPLLVNVDRFDDPALAKSMQQLLFRTRNWIEQIEDKMPNYIEGDVGA